MTTPFDSHIILWLNQFAHSSPVTDQAIDFLANSHLLKGGVVICLLWFAWFRHPCHRHHLIATLLGSFVAMASARALASLLPYRPRPLHLAELDLTLPYGMAPVTEQGWWASSAFPSDHAVLFFALAGGLCLVNRRLGIAALFYVTLMIALPRIYLGLHYPTDILAGALLGLVIIRLANSQWVVTTLAAPLLSVFRRQPAWCYPALFLITYQIADMFESSRALVGLVLTLLTQVAV